MATLLVGFHMIKEAYSDKNESYHDIMFFLGGSNASSNGKLGFLINTTALYTTSVSVNGSTFRQIWQWK